VDGWKITVSAIAETTDRLRTLKTTGGYIITHIGCVEREDGSAYRSEILDELLTCLQYFLSFAIGRWAGLALPVSIDSNGHRVYEEWGLRKTAVNAWNASCSWFDEKHGGLLPETFPGFWTLWQSETWHRALSTAIYWYCQANDRGIGIGVDTGLVLAQTALELLAWTYCVEDRKILSQAAFKRHGLSAADKLRLLAFAVGVPTDIPPEFAALHSKPGQKWVDAMHAITDIRNSLIHPDKLFEIPDDCYYDAWRLSLWYTELSLLRFCRHDGKYANRLRQRFVGRVEDVPWARAPDNL
jgi:hypothetical protein